MSTRLPHIYAGFAIIGGVLLAGIVVVAGIIWEGIA
jgi:hypothetical protein